MPTFVPSDWVQHRLGSSAFLPLDPRSPVRYLQGHLQGAANLPLNKLFDAQGRLRPVGELADLLGSAGLTGAVAPILYSTYDGQDAAMLAWVLEYLGRRDVHILSLFFEQWKAQGSELFYRPVTPKPGEFVARVNPDVRATFADLLEEQAIRLLDTRSQDEFTGRVDTEGTPGHIPGAVHIDWREFVSREEGFLRSERMLRQLLESAGLEPQEQVVVYCRTGVRAALGYLALRRMGYLVKLYDGSYADWVRQGQPVEAAPEPPAGE